MKASLLLCDNAEVHNGRLYSMGGGLTWIWANYPTPISVAALFDLELAELGQEIPISVRVTAADGSPVFGSDSDGNSFEYAFSDRILTPNNGSSHDAELDYLWAGRWPGIHLPAGDYRVVMTNDATGEIVGRQSFTAYASNN